MKLPDSKTPYGRMSILAAAFVAVLQERDSSPVLDDLWKRFDSLRSLVSPQLRRQAGELARHFGGHLSAESPPARRRWPAERQSARQYQRRRRAEYRCLNLMWEIVGTAFFPFPPRPEDPNLVCCRAFAEAGILSMIRYFDATLRPVGNYAKRPERSGIRFRHLLRLWGVDASGQTDWYAALRAAHPDWAWQRCRDDWWDVAGGLDAPFVQAATAIGAVYGATFSSAAVRPPVWRRILEDGHTRRWHVGGWVRHREHGSKG